MHLRAIAGILLIAGCSRGSPSADGSLRRGAVRSDTLAVATTQSDTVVEGLTGEHRFLVLSPAAGAVLIEGESYTIRWRAPTNMGVNVGAAVGGKDKGHLAFDLPAGTDSLRWTVPAGFVSGFGPTQSSAVRVRIENARDPAQYVDSKLFTIKAVAMRR